MPRTRRHQLVLDLCSFTRGSCHDPSGGANFSIEQWQCARENIPEYFIPFLHPFISARPLKAAHISLSLSLSV